MKILALRDAVKPHISSILKNTITASSLSSGEFPLWKQAEKYFLSISTKGKMLRAALTCLGSLMAGKPYDNDTLIVASTIELAHTGLLIQDDAMDDDRLRRDAKSLFALYDDMFQKTCINPITTAKYVSFCAGDIGFFLTFRLIHSMRNSYKDTVLSILTDELNRVAAGQMLDTYYQSIKSYPSEKEILAMYSQKTGRYTVFLPLYAGFIMAGGSSSYKDQILDIGKNIGIAYQLHDDEIGLVGSDIGKPIGSDLRQGKKTLVLSYIFTRSNAEERKKVQSFIGSAAINAKNMLYIKDLLSKYRILEDVGNIKQSYVKKALKRIENLQAPGNAKDMLREFANYTIMREH